MYSPVTASSDWPSTLSAVQIWNPKTTKTRNADWCMMTGTDTVKVCRRESSEWYLNVTGNVPQLRSDRGFPGTRFWSDFDFRFAKSFHKCENKCHHYIPLAKTRIFNTILWGQRCLHHDEKGQNLNFAKKSFCFFTMKQASLTPQNGIQNSCLGKRNVMMTFIYTFVNIFATQKTSSRKSTYWPFCVFELLTNYVSWEAHIVSRARERSVWIDRARGTGMERTCMTDIIKVLLTVPSVTLCTVIYAALYIKQAASERQLPTCG